MMAKNTMSVPAEVSVQAKLDESGITLKAKSRAIAALDRLVSNAADWFSAKLESSTRTEQIKQANREALMRAEGDSAVSLAKEDPLFGARLKTRFIEEETRKQLNREAVATEFLELQSSLSPPSSEDEEPDGAESIDDDWFNVFSSFAEKASSERMRKVLARILAGEVRRSGSFSIRALRIVSELDQKAASAFEELVSARISDEFIVKPQPLKGEALMNLVLLEEVGLLQEANSILSVDFTPTDGFVVIEGPNPSGQFKNGELYLRIAPKDGAELRIGVVKITAAGAELAKLLPPVPLMNIFENFFTQVVGQVDEACIYIYQNDSSALVPVKVLKSRNVAQ